MSASRLEAVCIITMGQAPAGESYNDRGDGLPLIAGAGDFDHGVPRAKKYTTHPTKVSQPGDLIVSIRASIGDLVVGDQPYCLGRGVAALRARSAVDSDYLRHWFRFNSNHLRAKGKGATFLQVNREDIGEMPIQVPPVSEQRQIAAILDQAECVLMLRRKWLQGLVELKAVAFNRFANSGENRFTRLGELLDRIESGRSPVCLDRKPVGSEWGVLKLSAVTGGEFDPREAKALPDTIEPRPQDEVLVGDILLARKNTLALVGSSVLVKDTTQRLLMSDLIFRLVIGDGSIDPTYLQMELTRAHVREAMRRFAGGSAGSMPNVSKARLADVVVGVPPRAIQDEYVAVSSEIDGVRAMGVRSLGLEESLFASLQHRAFRGEL